MKKLYYLLLFIVMATVTVVSCDDEPLEGEFSATGDGSELGEPDPDSDTCAAAFEALQAAEVAFGAATEANFMQVCTSYATILQVTIDTCGDSSGNLQATLTSLGDCSVPDACLQAEVAANVALSALNNATDDNEEMLCLAYSAALGAQINACGDPSGSIQAIRDSLNCGGDCAAAQVATAEALELFNNVDGTDEMAFVEACGAYSMALQAEILACGDPDGDLEAIVQELGDCSLPEEDGPVRVVIDGVQTNFNTASVTIAGSLLSVVATDIDTGDTFTFDVVLSQTGENVMQNIELTVGGVIHTPLFTGDAAYINEITANDGTTIVGTFSGTFLNPAGAEVITTTGIIDIMY